MGKPDNVVDSPGLLPYGSNIGAPAIKVDDVHSWKMSKVIKLNKQFETRFLELKNEYEKLLKEHLWNEVDYQSKFNFEPVIGEIYHLYYGNNNQKFLSLVKPNEWKREHIGSFILDSDNKWKKI